MSFDIGMAVDTGGEWPASVGEWHNYTYNVSPMFFRAFGEGGIRKLHGMTGEEAAPLISTAMEYFREHADELRAINPANGWGDYDGALRFLGMILDEAQEHPKALVGVR